MKNIALMCYLFALLFYFGGIGAILINAENRVLPIIFGWILVSLGLIINIVEIIINKRKK